MSKQFTVITKDGSKWLRPVNPFDNNDPRFTSKEPFCILGMRPCSKTVCECDEWKKFEKNNPILPYIGNRPDGTTLDESEVREVRQYQYEGEWFDCYNDGFYASMERHPDIATRTAYTYAESHDRHIRSFNTQNVRPLVNQLVGEEISFGRFIELLNEIANTH